MKNSVVFAGRSSAEDHEDAVACDPRIDELRDKTQVIERKQFTIDYLDPEKRSFDKSVQVFFKGGSHTKRVFVEYPMGHRRLRKVTEFERNLRWCILARKAEAILSLCSDRGRLETTAVDRPMDLFAI